jgi:hypothetical protein
MHHHQQRQYALVPRAHATIWTDGIQARDDAMDWTKAHNQSGDTPERIAARIVSAVGGWSVSIGPKRVPCTEWMEYLAEDTTRRRKPEGAGDE